MFPFTFHAHPDFKVVMDEALLDSAEQTSEDPQTIVYKIKENAICRTAADLGGQLHLLLGAPERLHQDNDVAGTTGYDQ